MSAAAARPLAADNVTDFSARKLELIEGAAEVFARAGYHGCSMRDVAERIGIRQSSIYHHFRSKDEILAAICTYGGESFLRNIRAIFSRTVPTSRPMSCASTTRTRSYSCAST